MQVIVKSDSNGTISIIGVANDLKNANSLIRADYETMRQDLDNRKLTFVEDGATLTSQYYDADYQRIEVSTNKLISFPIVD